MPGPLPKPADERQRNNAPALTVVADGTLTLADAPPRDGWPPDLVKAWGEYWASPLAATVAENDLPGLYRAWDMRAAIAEMEAAITAEGYVTEGFKGQPVANPLIARVQAMYGPLLQLEKEYGLTPASKARLGIQGAKAHKTIRDAIATAPVVTEEDPRRG